MAKYVGFFEGHPFGLGPERWYFVDQEAADLVSILVEVVERAEDVSFTELEELRAALLRVLGERCHIEPVGKPDA